MTREEMAYWIGKVAEVVSGNDVLADPLEEIKELLRSDAVIPPDGWELGDVDFVATDVHEHTRVYEYASRGDRVLVLRRKL